MKTSNGITSGEAVICTHNDQTNNMLHFAYKS